MASWSKSQRMPSGDCKICALTSYFNPEKFQSKKKNFDLFSAALHRQGVHLFVIELAFADEAFELSPQDLPPGQQVVQIRARSVLWQKERLLNCLLAELPQSYSKVIWLDCDLIFERDDWLEATDRALDRFPLVQPFTAAIRLPSGQTNYSGEGDIHQSFGSRYHSDSKVLHTGEFDEHGHTGFAWAARREWLARCGLYDCCLSGSGDHLMAHAFCGDWRSACVTRLLHPPCPYYDHFRNWAIQAFQLVRGDIGAVDGRILHLWHGRRKDRGYLKRNQELASLGFDPTTDLIKNDDGCWEFTNENPAVADWSKRYFQPRQEDAMAN